jgi:hypothetical protein
MASLESQAPHVPKPWKAPSDLQKHVDVMFSTIGVQLISVTLMISAILSLACPVSATDYYLSLSGDDSNAGTSSTLAWRSISRLNSLNLVAGDRILFEHGSRFAGPLIFDSADQGTETNPIVITSYGIGRATIEAGDGPGLFAHNTAGIFLSQVNFIGAGRTENSAEGVFFYNELPGDIRLGTIHIDNIEVSGFGKNGIVIGGWNGQSGFRDVQITQTDVHDNGLNGLITYAQEPNVHEHVSVRDVRSFRNSGISTVTPSGSGIVFGGVNGGTIEWSVAHDNGMMGDAGVGIWTHTSTNILIQYNESFDNQTSGEADGGGFDLDGGVTNSIMQYNYSHGNDGAGYGLYQYPGAPPWFGNTVRYNMSIDDGRKNGYSAIRIWNGGSGLANAEIYHNLVFISSSEHGIPSALSFVTGTSRFSFHHNAFFASGQARLITVVPEQMDLSASNNSCWSMADWTLRDNILEAEWCNRYHRLEHDS